MEQLKGLPLGRQLILGAGVLLFIDMFFAWQSVDVGPFSVSRNGWHGFWGILLGLLTLVLVAWVLVRAFGIEIPVNVPDGLTSLALGALTGGQAVQMVKAGLDAIYLSSSTGREVLIARA
jgi:hypothetical protein